MTGAQDDIDFTFDDLELKARPGETIAAALLRAGIGRLRSDRSGLPRGMYCGMGVCYDCVVQVDGRPQIRACMTEVSPGMSVASSPSLQAQRPAWSAPQESGPQACDLLIVGAGPAGLSAALAGARDGLKVVVLDERKLPGGQFFKQKAVSSRRTDRQQRLGGRLVARVRAAGATILTSATVWGAFADNALAASVGDRTVVFKYKKLIVATGAYERPHAFDGWTLPGVMTTGAGQTLIRAYDTSPGDSIVIAGNGPLNFQLAAELVRGGARVTDLIEASRPSFAGLLRLTGAALASPALMLKGAFYLCVILRHGVRLGFGRTVVGAEGTERVETVAIAAHGAARGTERIRADTLCIGYGFLPSAELPVYLGAAGREGGDPEGLTDLPDVYVVGDCRGIGGAFMAMAQARLAALHAAHALTGRLSVAARLAGAVSRLQFERHRLFQRLLWGAFRPPEDMPPSGAERLVCRCEEVSAAALAAAIDPDAASARDLKQSTRIGMGPCQGRNCRIEVEAILSRAPLRVRDEPSPRIPFKPVPIGSVAAMLPDPRRTSLAGSTPPRAMPSPRIETAADVDVAVIGAGIVGQTLAFLLAREGMKVCLVDQGNYNAAASGLNAGSLHVQMTGYFAEEFFDPSHDGDRSGMSELLPLGMPAIETWKWLQRELGSNLDLDVHGGLIVAETPADEATLRRKIDFERSLGLPVEYVTRAQVAAGRPWLGPSVIGGAWCPIEGKVNPLLAGRALLDACRKAGVRILRYAPVGSIERGARGFRVATGAGAVFATRLVNACGARANEIASLLGTSVPVAGKTIQLSVTEPVPVKLDLLLGHARTRLTMKQTYAGNILVGGGWPADTYRGAGSFDIRYDSLRGNLGAALRVFPALADFKLLRTWSGVAPVTGRGAPLVGEMGEIADAYVCATEVGYTLGPLCARHLVDMITGRRPTVMVGPPAGPETKASHDVPAFH